MMAYIMEFIRMYVRIKKEDFDRWSDFGNDCISILLISSLTQVSHKETKEVIYSSSVVKIKNPTPECD